MLSKRNISIPLKWFVHYCYRIRTEVWLEGRIERSLTSITRLTKRLLSPRKSLSRISWVHLLGRFSVTPFKKTLLAPDGAVQIACGNIAGFFCPINGVCVDFAFLDGFLVVKSPVELDVVGVYTARQNKGDVETIDVETVQARKISSTVKVETDDEGTYDHVSVSSAQRHEL